MTESQSIARNSFNSRSTFCNIESPPGTEAQVGALIFDWMKREGFAPRKVAMLPERFNVLGVMPGTGDNYSLIFNSHMYTGRSKADLWSLRDANAGIDHGAWRSGDTPYCEGIVNDKGPMAAFLIAAKAVRTNGLRPGDGLRIGSGAGSVRHSGATHWQLRACTSRRAGRGHGGSFLDAGGALLRVRD